MSESGDSYIHCIQGGYREPHTVERRSVYPYDETTRLARHCIATVATGRVGLGEGGVGVE